MKPIEQIMRTAPVIPVLVIEDAADAVPLAQALVAGGLRVLEVTLRTPAALDAIRAMREVEGAIVGAGTVGHSLFDAYSAAFPNARFRVWNRTRAKAEAMAETCPGLRVADDLERAVRDADIVTSATMSTDPILKGEWLRPGQHIDVIGAYRPDMREVDDTALTRARVFVDSYDTTVGHIGEIKIPLEAGTISRDDLIADHYSPSGFTRTGDDEITLFKNGGGAHLDLMTSRYILDAWQSAR